MSLLVDLDAAKAAAAIKKGELKSEALVRASLERINSREPSLHAFRDLASPDEILTRARDLDSRKVRTGALYGVPVAVKEVFDVKGLRCCWGTSIHKDRVPKHDAVVVTKLRDAGAIILGTTISTEYAIAAGGPTTNPYDPSRTPGGSSSGSAAAIAAKMVPLALGSQTVGSVIRPAVYCGVYGFKPAHGVINAQGTMPLSLLLDHVGILAGSPADVALGYSVLSGSEIEFDELQNPLRVHVVETNLSHRIEPPTRTALERARRSLESIGAILTPNKLPHDFDGAVDVLNTILRRDIAIHHGGDKDRAGELMSARMRELVDLGRAISNEHYADAAHRAEGYRQYLLDLLADNSIILAPATDGIAPPLNEGTGSADLQGLYTLAGLPTLAVPCGKVDGLPVGVQIVAAPGRETLLFTVADAMRSQAAGKERDKADCGA